MGARERAGAGRSAASARHGLPRGLVRGGSLPRVTPRAASATRTKTVQAPRPASAAGVGAPPATGGAKQTSGPRPGMARPLNLQLKLSPLQDLGGVAANSHALPSARYAAVLEKRYGLAGNVAMAAQQQQHGVAAAHLDTRPLSHRGGRVSGGGGGDTGSKATCMSPTRAKKASRVHTPPRQRPERGSAGAHIRSPTQPALRLSFDSHVFAKVAREGREERGAASARSGCSTGTPRQTRSASGTRHGAPGSSGGTRAHAGPRYGSASSAHPRLPVHDSPRKGHPGAAVRDRQSPKAALDAVDLTERMRELGIPVDTTPPGAYRHHGQEYQTFASPKTKASADPHQPHHHATPTLDELHYQGRTLFGDPMPKVGAVEEHDYEREADVAILRPGGEGVGAPRVERDLSASLNTVDAVTPPRGTRLQRTESVDSSGRVGGGAHAGGRRAGGYSSPNVSALAEGDWSVAAEPPAFPIASPPRASRPPQVFSSDGAYASLTTLKNCNLSSSEETRRRELLKRTASTRAPPSHFKPYTIFAHPDCGSVFEEIHKQLAALPFWACKRDNAELKNEVAAAKALHGQMPNVDVLLENRYVTDRITANWVRHKEREEKTNPRRKAGKGKGKVKRRVGAEDTSSRASSRDSGESHTEGHTTLVNSYSGTKCLTLKAAMVKTLRKRVVDPWKITPEAFVLNAALYGADERQEFQRRFHALRSAHGERVWICKPSHRNKGIGIKSFASVSETLSYVDTDGVTDGNGKAAQYVVQKYIERPFLVHKRKFDLRSWCVLTPSYDVYVYREGVLRTASEEYNLKDLSHDLSHLTNHCIQEHGPNFGKYVHNNEMWYWQFQRYLDALPVGEVGHGWSLKNDILPQVNRITVDCLLAARGKVTESAEARDGDRLGCFQLFGFDFMIDADGKVWLIEINGSPASAEYLLEGMMRDLINTVIAPHFPPPPGHTYPQPEPNKFDLVYRDARDGKARQNGVKPDAMAP